MGRYKSYHTDVQNEGGGVKAPFGQCPKERHFLMSSLNNYTVKQGQGNQCQTPGFKFEE